MYCRYCGKECKKPCGLAIDERVCKSNPNRRPLENNGNGWTRGGSEMTSLEEFVMAVLSIVFTFYLLCALRDFLSVF